MVSETYACAYQEVIEVLKYTRPEDVNKIPIGKIRYYIEHMSKSHNFEIDTSKSLDMQELSEEAKAILADLYKDYWATDYEKERIEAKENYDMEQIARERYNPDNLFNKKETIENNTIEENTSLIVIKEEKWYTKIFNKIKRLLGKHTSYNNTNDKLTKDDIERAKGDGSPYARMAEEEFKKMSYKEKKELNAFMKELNKKFK